MSPAGHWPQLQAAIEGGADAVYFGLKHFTARAKVGFGLSDLPEVMRTLHRRGVRGFVTFNTLVFDHEIDEAARTLARIAEAGADAIIVQDIGVLRLARAVVPGLEIHASTQMSVTDAAGAELAREMGARRVTLARELSLAGLRTLRAQTVVELEVFVHGALCVAYSGQCFSSEAWGGRSANRGACAQACRLPYEMYVDDALKPLGDARYLLSPGDLYALHQVPELIDIGINAFKIEGRYKEAGYVAAATQAYRKAIDDVIAGRKLRITKEEDLQLEQIYSRGLGPFFLNGTNHQAVVRGRAPRHRGVQIGTVTRIEKGAVHIQAIQAVKPGDGIVFDAAGWRSPEEPEEGGRLYAAAAAPNGDLQLKFGAGEIQFDRIRPGDLVWRTHDPALDKELRRFTNAASPVHKQPLSVHVIAHTGNRLKAIWRVATTEAVVESPDPLDQAQNRGLDRQLVQQQFERLGNTAYELTHLEIETEGNPFVPASLLNQLRRQAVEQLTRLQTQIPTIEIRDPKQEVATLRAEINTSREELGPPAIHLLVRTADQLEAAIDQKPASLTLDYLDLYGLKPSVDRVRDAGVSLRVASPRILKPGEEKIADFLLRLDCPILIRPAGLLVSLCRRTTKPLTGDFSLNAANGISAHRLLSLGLERITPTHDLNGEQVAGLARAVGGARIEAIVYQHLPVFHTEHCVFCRFLSTGTSYKDCGRPCETHRVELGDPTGRRHPVLADVGCRNTVFGAEAQEASQHLESWLRAGIRHFRIEFAHESAAQVTCITQAFRQTLDGEKTCRQLTETLRRLAPQRTTQGSLYVPDGYKQLPVLQ